MSVKKMVELYVSYGLDDCTWHMLYNMVCHNLITRSNWEEFYKKCRSWYYNEDASAIVDGDGNAVYVLDENGFYKEL